MRRKKYVVHNIESKWKKLKVKKKGVTEEPVKR